MTSSTVTLTVTFWSPVLAQFGDGSLLDFVGDCVEPAAVMSGECEVNHGGEARTPAAAGGWRRRRVVLSAGAAAVLLALRPNATCL
jgi:hypothetical protein